MKVLYVDREPELREIVVFLLESSLPVDVVAVATVGEALRALDGDPALGCVVCDYALDDGNAETLQAGLRARGRRTPFILCGPFPPEKYAAFRAHPVQGYAPKPDFLEALRAAIAGLAGLAPAPADETPYCRIRTATALKVGILKFDVYQRLEEGRYARIFRRGDAIDGNAAGRYRIRDLEYVYLARADATIALASLTSLFARFAGACAFPAEAALGISRSALETIADFNQAFGFTEEVRRLTRAAVGVAVQTIREQPRLAEIAAPLWNGPERYGAGHSIALAHLACGIASLVGRDSELAAYKLCLAAFLHDVTLTDDRLARVRSLAELSVRDAEFDAAEKAAYRAHPRAVADLIASFPELPPETAAIVLQHHEFPDGSGFPDGVAAEAIHPLAAILIFAHELLGYRDAPAPRRDFSAFVAALGPRYGDGPFGRIRRAVLEAWREPAAERG